MKRILKIKLKLLLSNTILATIFILYFSIFIKATTSFEANSETTTTTTTNISDIKPSESVKSINSSYPNLSSVKDEQILKKNQTWHNSIERGWRTKRQNSPEEFAPSNHQNEPHYERLMLLDSNPVDETESESLTSQPTSTSTTSTKPTKGKRTLYACEEKQLQIECQLGESIQLIRANYGRFSIQICNEHGQLDWKVNCMSPSSFQIIANSCHAKQSCQLLASDSIFGNSCPGTQKYLEVHYQCVSGNQLANNRTATSTGFDGAQSKPQHQVTPPPPPSSSLPVTEYKAQNHSQRPNNNVNVIPHLDTVNSERNTNSAFGRHPIPSLPTAPQLPPWMVDVPIQAQPHPQPSMQLPLPLPPLFANHTLSQTSASSTARAPFCPGKVLRQIRWPETEPGLVVQMPCPSHARSSNSLEPYAASLVCLQNGQWATRVQAGRCQSIWLKNLTKQLETGDSLLAILSALIRETKPPATPLQVNWGGGGGGGSGSGGGATISNSAPIETQTSSLFGDDLVQISRIVRRLVEEMVELLNRINDDKQRLAFAREMVQSLVELVNNMAHEHQLDAWLDLARISGERQRVSGQFVQAIEGASVLLAGASQQHLSNNNQQQQQQQQQHSTDQVNPSSEDLVFRENVYVTIRSLPISIPNSNNNNNNLQNRSLEVSFPSETSTFGFWWMNNQQRLTLHLQAAAQQQLVNSASLEQSSQVDVKYPQQQQQQQQQLEQSTEQFGVQTLKIVFVMIKGLGSQMEPKTSTSDIITTTNSDNFVTNTHNKQRFIVNSNLVSLSIVADSRFKPVKVELSAPIELVFKHLFPSYNSAATTAENLANRTVKSQPPRCVYWDNNISDWLSDGCKLVATNRTHSTCACNHLTTFALLDEWSSLVEESANLNFNNNQVTTSDVGLMNSNMDAQNQQFPYRNEQQQQPRVQLDSVENKLILPNKVLYLAKMLDGHLFGSNNDNYYDEQQQIAANGFLTSTTNSNNEQQATTNCRLLIYISCLISATLLALQMAAAAYNKAHARRLLGAIPANPPPSLLVTNLRVANSTPSALNLNHHQVPNSIMTNHHHHHQATNCSDQTSPTYSSSDYSVALQASKAKLEQQQLREQLAFNEQQQQPLSKLFHSATTGSVSQHLKQVTFPIHLVVQLFILELLIVLLVESQNYLEHSSRQANLINSTLYWQTAQLFHPELVVATPPPPQSDQLNPIGFITWFLVVALYYLIAAITCWLAGQLIKLNVSLMTQHSYLKQLLAGSCSPSSVGSSTEANSDKSIHYGATNSTAISSSAANPVPVSICSQQQQQNSRLPVATNNFYGQNSFYGQYNGNTTSTHPHQLHHLNNLHSSTSPTSSFSSTGNQSISDPNTALSRLEVDSTRLYGETPRFGGGISISSSKKVTSFDGHRFINLPLDKLYLFVIHILPVFLIIVIALISANKIESLNGLFYTTNFSFQIAYWPLLVELTSTPLSSLLYYEPAICLILAASALYMLRSAYNWTTTTTTQNGPISRYVAARKQAQAPAQAVVNPYGSSTINNTASSRNFQHISHSATANNNNNNFPVSNNQMVQNKQSEGQNGQLEFGAKWSQMVDFRTNGDLKRAKFFCTMLLAILALHSICWISFFAHIHQALNSAPLVSSLPQQQQQQQHSWLKFGSNHLTYVFTLSNLTLALLISWWQRKTLRRAAQLSGITRFLCTSSGAERSRQHTRFYRHQTSVNGAGAKVSNGGAQVKVSPSSQSLFIVSSQQQQQQQQQQPSYHYGPSYSSGSHQVSQHLYQQLSNQQQQQHIYDSTSAINLVGNEQHHRFNMLLQQQQQQQQQQQRHLHQMHQQDAFTLNRSMQQRQFAQQQLEQRQLMTLKPTTSMLQDDNGQLLILDANQALKQQQQQQQRQQQNGFNCQSNKTTYLDRSGEAEGPLVAFTSSSASSGAASNSSSSTTNDNNNHHQMPVTFGPNSAALHHQQRQFQQEQQQQHNNFQMMSSEHQLFSQQQDQSVASVASPTINCISSASNEQQQQQPTRHSTLATRTSAADANQHQYCSINNNPVGGNTSKNYTDALKAALLEQQQQHQHESSLALSQQPHFRPRLEAAANSIAPIGQTVQSTGISGAKHSNNNNNNNNHLLLHNHEQQLALLRHQADNSNIYDVANYALNNQR